MGVKSDQVVLLGLDRGSGDMADAICAAGFGLIRAPDLSMLASHLAWPEWSVVVVDADGARAERVAADLPGAALFLAADVSSEPDVERYTAAALERYGRLDLYHLNAGIAGPLEPFPELDVADFDRVVAVNLRGLFLGLRAA